MSAQYPLAIWRAANANNFRSGRSQPIDRIVIHVTDGPATQAIQTANWFGNPNAGVSAHYVVGRAGEIYQCVRHENTAHHAGPANSHSIGIEHVVPHALNPPTVTPNQYMASARLVRWLCSQYQLPVNRTTIRGHSEVDPTTGHLSCPQLAWQWPLFQQSLDFLQLIEDLAAGNF